MEQVTDNYKKHTSTNLLQRFLLDNFFNVLVGTLKSIDYSSSEAQAKSRSILDKSSRQARTIKSIESVLDVGCGEGFTLYRLAEEKIGKHLEGIEYLQTAIDIGKKIHPNIRFKKGDIYQLPYKDNSFDLTICTEVLEHLADPKKALKELVRVSSTYCLLSVPNEPFFMAANFLRGKNWSRFGNDIEHIQHWSSKGFAQFVLDNCSAHVIAQKHPFPWTVLLLRKN